MSAEIFGALRLLEKERGISMDFMLEKINKAIITACKNTYDGNEDVVVNIDEENGIFEVELLKTVTEEVEFPGKEISLEDAREIDKFEYETIRKNCGTNCQKHYTTGHKRRRA